MCSSSAVSKSSWRPLLLADRGCPFAHRVRALFEHLGVDYELREAELGHLPEGLGTYSPTGRIPLLVDGAITIGESRVMLEYVAETAGFATAWPAMIAERTGHRHGMALMDAVVVPALLRGDAGLRPARIAECLDVFERVARVTPPDACLLLFHFAPIWLRLRTWRPDGAVTRAIRERPDLVDWLDALAAHPAVGRTSRTEEQIATDFRDACELGMTGSNG